MLIDETANIEEAAQFVRMSKMSDFGSGCSCDGNLMIEASIYDSFLEALQFEGGYLTSNEEKDLLETAMWDAQGRRTFNTIACPASNIAAKAGFKIPEGKKFIIVQQEEIGKEHFFSSEKLSPVLAVFKYSGFSEALKKIDAIFEVGGKGHSCSIYSFNEDHINRLASHTPVCRIMVRQPTYLSNSGSFTNGMPMTASLGVGTWGGTVTSENIHLKHYMNTTLVSYQIAEDRPTEEELFGEFYQTETF
jgi:sulfoacetaldehyde dehydrogenase